MDSQRTLFDAPLSRDWDPASSFEAADKLARSGKWRKQKAAVLKSLSENEGSTSAELAVIMAVDRHLTARRLPELKNQGYVVQGSARPCWVTRRRCVTWWTRRN